MSAPHEVAPLFTAEQRHFYRQQHEKLVDQQRREIGGVVFEQLNLDTGYSIIASVCECTTNPLCTGFVIGIIDIQHGCRAAASPTRDELQRLGEALLKASAQ